MHIYKIPQKYCTRQQMTVIHINLQDKQLQLGHYPKALHEKVQLNFETTNQQNIHN